MAMNEADNEVKIFLDGVDVTAVCVRFWPDDGVIEIAEGGAVVRKYGRVEVRRVRKEVVANNDNK